MQINDAQPVDSMVSGHITRMGKLDPSQHLAYEDALKTASSTAYIGMSRDGDCGGQFSNHVYQHP
jgi:hypothetical protein